MLAEGAVIFLSRYFACFVVSFSLLVSQSNQRFIRSRLGSSTYFVGPLNLYKGQASCQFVFEEYPQSNKLFFIIWTIGVTVNIQAGGLGYFISKSPSLRKGPQYFFNKERMIIVCMLTNF